MEKGLSMNARTEITKKFATAYKAASKAEKSVLLDQLCEVTGMDCDNGSEFINHDLIGWAAERDIYFTRSRPYKKND